MKIMITGAYGQLGQEMIAQLDDQEHVVLALDLPELDITSYQDVKSYVLAEEPDVIINCAAFTNVDACERQIKDAFRINSLGAKNLALASNMVGAKIVHLSTDYVFDGLSHHPYREYDQPAPGSIYGKSKFLGEQFVSAHNPKHFILRTAWLFGNGKNFVQTMLDLAKTRNTLQVVNDQFGTPTSTAELTELIQRLMVTDYYGIYHTTSQGSCTWYDFAEKIFELRNMDILVQPITTDMLNRVAPRPYYSVLDNFMLDLTDMDHFSHWETALKNYLKV